ncbi:MAG: hypothetical protein IPK00_03580 [Deltaproteobacteria bacterium]|nr:hypothetical protein [Deltaproteobacteria bacterium]
MAGRFGWVGAAFGIAAFVAGCGGGSAEGPLLLADAQFNPPTAATAFRPVNEANRAVAQIFTVGLDGRLEEFWLVITDGNSNDAGTVRITVQPVLAGDVIDDDPNNSLIDPILVNTATLPVAIEQFTEFNIGDEPGRDVLTGEKYALVVEFVSRATNNDAAPIALVLGQTGNPFATGAGATGQLGVGFTNNTEDYFFRTFILN